MNGIGYKIKKTILYILLILLSVVCMFPFLLMIDLTIRRFDTMRTIFAEYNPKHNSIDVYTSVGYMLRIDCWEAEKDLKTTPGSDCALNALTIDEPLEYARLYLDGNLLDVSVSQSVYIRTFYRFLI